MGNGTDARREMIGRIQEKAEEDNMNKSDVNNL